MGYSVINVDRQVT